jgi:hypothetical protein
MNELERLSAVNSIRNCKSRYIRGTDTMDWELFGTAFTEDAEWDLRGFAVARTPWTGEWNSIANDVKDFDFLDGLSTIVPWPVRGRSEIVAAARDHTKWLGSFHAVFNPEIKILSPNHATAAWPFQDVLHFPPEAPIRTFNGYAYYHETYELVDGEWLIKTCRLERLLCSLS